MVTLLNFAKCNTKVFPRSVHVWRGSCPRCEPTLAGQWNRRILNGLSVCEGRPSFRSSWCWVTQEFKKLVSVTTANCDSCPPGEWGLCKGICQVEIIVCFRPYQLCAPLGNEPWEPIAILPQSGRQAFFAFSWPVYEREPVAEGVYLLFSICLLRT